MSLLVALLLAAPPPGTFTAPLDSARWYVGTPEVIRDGALRIARDGWIASRGIPDATIETLEVRFRSRGGALALTFHDADEALSGPLSEAILVPRRGGAERTLVVTRSGATLDGASLPWEGALRGTFLLRAVRGELDLVGVAVAPAPPPPDPVPALDRRTVHLLTTPRRYRDDQGPFARTSLTLWDVEVCFLFRRGPSAFVPLVAPARGAPVLGALVTVGDGKALSARAAKSALAMGDWGDERRNLSEERFAAYLAQEYAVFDLLMQAQRALNAALPGRDGLDALVCLAAIRHSENAHAALGLAETLGAREALAALREALGKGVDPARCTGDQLRGAAGRAARLVLGDPPEAWPGFRFEPQSRYLTLQQARDLLR